TFAESKPLAALTTELKKRDQQLAAKPAKTINPPAAYYRESRPVYRKIERAGRKQVSGKELIDLDFDRYELHLVPRETKEGRTMKCPCFVDVPGQDVLFSLVDTDWDGTFKRGKDTFALSLRYAGRGKQPLKLILDPNHLSARVADDDETQLPLGFVERHLRNFA